MRLAFGKTAMDILLRTLGVNCGVKILCNGCVLVLVLGFFLFFSHLYFFVSYIPKNGSADYGIPSTARPCWRDTKRHKVSNLKLLFLSRKKKLFVFGLHNKRSYYRARYHYCKIKN